MIVNCAEWLFDNYNQRIETAFKNIFEALRLAKNDLDILKSISMVEDVNLRDIMCIRARLKTYSALLGKVNGAA